MRDARHAADHFSTASRLYQDPQLKQEYLFATVIACQGQVQNGYGKYHDRVIDSNDGIFTADGSGIANLLGIPLLVRRDPRGADSDYPDLSVLDNKEAMLLKRDIEAATVGAPGSRAYQEMIAQFDRMFGRQFPLGRPRSDNQGANGFGTSSTAWNGQGGPLGPVVVVRADGKPLPCQHMEAICAYIRDEVEPRLQHAIEGLKSGQLVDQREADLNTITREDFGRFYNSYKDARSGSDPAWTIADSPYEIKKCSSNTPSYETIIAAQRIVGIGQWSDHGTDFGWAGEILPTFARNSAGD